MLSDRKDLLFLFVINNYFTRPNIKQRSNTKPTSLPPPKEHLDFYQISQSHKTSSRSPSIVTTSEHIWKWASKACYTWTSCPWQVSLTMFICCLTSFALTSVICWCERINKFSMTSFHCSQPNNYAANDKKKNHGAPLQWVTHASFWASALVKEKNWHVLLYTPANKICQVRTCQWKLARV